MVLAASRVTNSALVAFLLTGAAARAQTSTQPAPGQPLRSGTAGSFEIVGNSIVSGQQSFLGTLKTVYIIDKTENNPGQINGHPAWAAEYSLDEDTARSMDIVTNTFCAGGNVLGNGTWLNAGGNIPVTWGGLNATDPNGGFPFYDLDGSHAVRLLDPCDDESCNWILNPANDLTTRRWYPSLETLEDGSIIIIGGTQYCVWVNDNAEFDNPTYEFFPSRGDPIPTDILKNNLPVNLFPITFLLPSGNLFLQLNWATYLLDYKTGNETALDDIPDAVRVYPASAGTAMLPLTPANNWTATVLLCGGTNLQPDQWTKDWDVAAYPASDSCVKITPDVSGSYERDDPLPEQRIMTSMVLLPNGKIMLFSGAELGEGGFGNDSWAIGQSYADKPVMTPALYDPDAPPGQRWSRDGISASTVPRMYHSSVTLLPDGSALLSGSNPNADYTLAGGNITYPSEYRVERFYPSYFNQRRPQPQGLPTTLSYGGPYFNVTLSSDDLSGNLANVQNTMVVVLRTGFSTHTLSMGQRFVQLENTYTANSDGSAVLHVSQVPPNPALLAPGPALLFVVVDGVPSVAVQVMIGSGKIETQQTSAVAELPSSGLPTSLGGNNNAAKNSGAAAQSIPGIGMLSDTHWSLSWLAPALVPFFLALLS